MRNILRLVCLVSCIVLFTEASQVKSSETKSVESAPVTVPTILPQKTSDAATPKRVYPTLSTQMVVANKTEAPTAAADTSSAQISTTPAVVTTEKTVQKDEEEEKEEDDVEEKQKPSTVDEDGFVKVKEQPVEPQSGRNPPSNKGSLDELSQPEESNFLSFLLVGLLLVVCIYLLQHNKKKLLGLMFEGRNGRRNVRYRRLPERDEAETFKEDIIY